MRPRMRTGSSSSPTAQVVDELHAPTADAVLDKLKGLDAKVESAADAAQAG